MNCEMNESMKLKYGKAWKYEKDTYESRKSGKLTWWNVAKCYMDTWYVDKWHGDKVKNDKVKNEKWRNERMKNEK